MYTDRRYLQIASTALSAAACMALVVWWGRLDLRSADSGAAAIHIDPFGEEQLRQLLSDRPAMKGVMQPTDFIYQWVAGQFGASDSKSRVLWKSHEPLSGRPAEHVRAYYASPATVSITAKESISPRDKWAMLVYEFHNLKHAPRIEELEILAASGEIERDRFALECFAAEFQAMEETQEFLRRHPIPGTALITDYYYLLLLNGGLDFDEYIKMLDAQSPKAYDPRKYFAKRFDEIHGEPGNPIKNWWNSFLGR